MKANFKKIQTPIGALFIVADVQKLYGVLFKDNWLSFKKRFELLEEKENSIIKKTAKQLREYFDGKRNSFDLPCELTGTDFQKKAWSALKKIPFGKTGSYKEQANLIHSPKAVRAVGRANGSNPICIILPCHRIVGSNGELTGYAGGLKAKKFLLNLERVLN